MNVVNEGVSRVDDLLNEIELAEPEHSRRPTQHNVTFREVTFFYENGGRKILDGVSFTARQGEITALVGPSGAGKSTIAELIPRFWDVSGGCIEIGGINIKEMSQKT